MRTVEHIHTTGDDDEHQKAVQERVEAGGIANVKLIGLEHSCSISGDPVTGPYILFSTVLIWGGLDES